MQRSPLVWGLIPRACSVHHSQSGVSFPDYAAFTTSQGSHSQTMQRSPLVWGLIPRPCSAHCWSDTAKCVNQSSCSVTDLHIVIPSPPCAGRTPTVTQTPDFSIRLAKVREHSWRLRYSPPPNKRKKKEAQMQTAYKAPFVSSVHFTTGLAMVEGLATAQR